MSQSRSDILARSRVRSVFSAKENEMIAFENVAYLITPSVSLSFIVTAEASSETNHRGQHLAERRKVRT
jgi:hypothetical protein